MTRSRSGRRARCCRRSGWSSATRCWSQARTTARRDRHDRARGGRPRRPAVPAARRASARCSHEGAGHRRRRLHRIAPRRRALARPRRRGRRHRLLHRLLPAARSRRRNLAGAARPPRLPLRRGRAAGRRPARRCSTASRTSSTWRRRPACARAGARDFRDLHRQQRRRDAAAARGRASAGRSHRFVYASSSSVYGDDAAIPMREDALPAAGLAVRRDQAGGRAPLPPLLTSTTACRRCRCGTSRCTARGSGRTWRSTGSFGRRCTGEPITLYGDGEQTRDFTFVDDAVAATMAAGDRGVPGRRL